MVKMNKIINVFTENIYPKWELDEAEVIKVTRKIVEFYLGAGDETQSANDEELNNKNNQSTDDIAYLLEISCLGSVDFDTVTFDILFCDGEKTHQINRDYRDKDYVADIITFAIFADDDSKFVLDGDVNLGEIIIALDKIEQEAEKTGVDKYYQLYFLIAHGILHLLGFDHQTEEDYNFVVSVQKKALKYAGIFEHPISIKTEENNPEGDNND